MEGRDTCVLLLLRSICWLGDNTRGRGKGGVREREGRDG